MKNIRDKTICFGDAIGTTMGTLVAKYINNSSTLFRKGLATGMDQKEMSKKHIGIVDDVMKMATHAFGMIALLFNADKLSEDEDASKTMRALDSVLDAMQELTELMQYTNENKPPFEEFSDKIEIIKSTYAEKIILIYSDIA